jgi:(1->4)-alpha-D-glucan 1-alpha-D-glucosylmutase
MPEEWAKLVRHWLEGTAAAVVRGAPDANDRLLILQAILGAWPMAKPDRAFRSRIEAFTVKALREAGRHTSWTNIDEAYESAALGLVRAALDPKGRAYRALEPFARRIAPVGAVTALSRTVLKLTMPGMPDTYQGTEFWDLSLVDPDNRRPVDYAARSGGLDDERPIEALFADWRDGRVKQRVTATLLRDRAARPELYAEGDYRPLAAEGARAANVAGFLRSHRGGERLAVAVPRLVATALGPDGDLAALDAFWGDTRLAVPAGRWRNILSGRVFDIGGDGVPLEALFAGFPFAALRTAA